VIPATREFMQQLRALTKQHNLLLIVDEVQSGCGRAGTLFAYELSGIEPDIMTLGKGIGGGVPLAALLSKAEIAVFEAGDQGALDAAAEVALRTAAWFARTCGVTTTEIVLLHVGAPHREAQPFDAAPGWTVTRRDVTAGSVEDAIVDEVRELDTHEFIAAAKPTLQASPNPQILYLSNAGSEDSEVLNAIRATPHPPSCGTPCDCGLAPVLALLTPEATT
jgi:hypothetical protein